MSMHWPHWLRPEWLLALPLLGYELVEGAVVDGKIRETRRISYAPAEAPAVAR